MRIKTLIILFLMTAALLSGCSTDSESLSKDLSANSISENNVTYNYSVSDYPVYKKTEELISASDIVLTGRVTDVSFKMLDYKTALPPTEESEEGDITLCTIYTVEVISIYKGNVSESINIRVAGGIKDKYLDQQIQVLGERASKGITVAEDMPEIKIGETYLFSLMVFEGTDPCLLNFEQGIISVSDFNSTVVKDEFGYISAKDIISYFGNEKWTAFESENFLEAE
ncbi:MAG: hypothetical protein HDT48_03905 [Ruminococcaceae bacterium]|nr:hypothetical protein [Oscillospiraceae bacterium]